MYNIILMLQHRIHYDDVKLNMIYCTYESHKINVTQMM